MPDNPGSIEEIDVRISTVRDNLRQLVEQAAAYSGTADDELVSQRIAELGSTARYLDQKTR
jgi:hypothetical protein